MALALIFENNSTSSDIHSYYWNFGDTASALADTSTNPTPLHTFSDTGIFSIKLVINRGEECSDSTTTIAKIYPGFVPNFSIDSSCILNPYIFTDKTTSKYGLVYNWRWNFGENGIAEDTSILQNPSYLYPSVGLKKIVLIVSNTKGCIDTVSKQVTVIDKPIITLPFKDTLICDRDTLQLFSSGSTTSSYSWAPAYNIIAPLTKNPFVYPKTTTDYIVTIADKGCTNTDTVKVNVVSNVFINLGADTTICKTDSMYFFPTTNALYFSWTPANLFNNATIKNPSSLPLTATQYNVTASVGKCISSDAITVRVVPYPVANAGIDTSICFGKTVVLNANITGSSFTWSPLNTLTKSNTLNPIANPLYSTNYILTVNDTLGCKKPSSDTVMVKVVPPVHAFAGNDTVIVSGQPLQLNATGGTLYEWSPTTGMNNAYIANPLISSSLLPDTITYRVKVTVPEGCSGYDEITVHIFKTLPEIFVPTAFTPNGDGRNDILKPTVAGLKQFSFFRIFNRYGQLVYTTSEVGKGWDGTLGGTQQPSGTYVFEAAGVDYLDHAIRRKGTVVLIR